mmetsp:Transcript_15992/g.37039  ORF Transcript_15992/g.37039 Transcript_15992/m.37039 type:complete len:274 (-) Transcript_15992:296-1117(-)
MRDRHGTLEAHPGAGPVHHERLRGDGDVRSEHRPGPDAVAPLPHHGDARRRVRVGRAHQDLPPRVLRVRAPDLLRVARISVDARGQRRRRADASHHQVPQAPAGRLGAAGPRMRAGTGHHPVHRPVDAKDVQDRRVPIDRPSAGGVPRPPGQAAVDRAAAEHVHHRRKRRQPLEQHRRDPAGVPGPAARDHHRERPGPAPRDEPQGAAVDADADLELEDADLSHRPEETGCVPEVEVPAAGWAVGGVHRLRGELGRDVLERPAAAELSRQQRP